jgi:GTP-binding protein
MNEGRRVKAEFVISAAAPEQFPSEGLPEVAFLGRSNVGKSTLLNMLVGQTGLARVSQTPGCTQLINFFRVEDRFHLVDLPGYGYARVPRGFSDRWKTLIESYLYTRKSLQLSVLLIDSRRGWMDKDRELRDWLEFHNRPYVVAATKVDKLNQKEEYHGLAAIRRELGELKVGRKSSPLPNPGNLPDPGIDDGPRGLTSSETNPHSHPDEPIELVPVSARTGRGVRELWQTIWKKLNL